MTPGQQDAETYLKSYQYLRAAMVGVLLCLGAAVAYQSWRQDPAILSSISAYYYTPALPIFVGSLVALGVCMIALQGTTRTEDVLLNIGGMFALVVAIVPTSRGEDHRDAVAACKESGGFVKDVDCPSVQALEEAAEVNVAVNMWALLVVGLAGLVAAYFLPGKKWSLRSKTHKIGFCVAVVLYVVGLVTFRWFRQGFIDRAHWVAAIGLFLCIVAVAIVNALRRQGKLPIAGAGLIEKSRTVVRVGLDPRHRYAAIALAMVVVGAAGGLLVLANALSVFWLEAALIALFAGFWIVQTRERWNRAGPAEPSSDSVVVVGAR